MSVAKFHTPSSSPSQPLFPSGSFFANSWTHWSFYWPQTLPFPISNSRILQRLQSSWIVHPYWDQTTPPRPNFRNGKPKRCNLCFSNHYFNMTGKRTLETVYPRGFSSFADLSHPWLSYTSEQLSAISKFRWCTTLFEEPALLCFNDRWSWTVLAHEVHFYPINHWFFLITMHFLAVIKSSVNKLASKLPPLVELLVRSTSQLSTLCSAHNLCNRPELLSPAKCISTFGRNLCISVIRLVNHGCVVSVSPCFR